MKTPRQLLLERHRSAETKLDTIRHALVAGLGSHRGLKSSEDRPSMRMLLRSLRWHLAGMSAVWLFVVLLNLEHSSFVPSIAEQKAASPRQLLLALRENRRQVLELTDPGVTESAPAPAAVVPSRRTQLSSSNAMA